MTSDDKEVKLGQDAVIIGQCDPKVKVKELRVKAGVWLNKGQIVAVFESKEAKNLKVKVKVTGTVVEVKVKVGDEVQNDSVIMTVSAKCNHSTLMKVIFKTVELG